MQHGFFFNFDAPSIERRPLVELEGRGFVSTAAVEHSVDEKENVNRAANMLQKTNWTDPLIPSPRQTAITATRHATTHNNR